jgi:hypothetical protein
MPDGFGNDAVLIYGRTGFARRDFESVDERSP